MNLLLKIMSCVLFDSPMPPLDKVNWKELFNEAKLQTVFLQVYNQVMPYLPKAEASRWETAAMRVYAQNLEVAMEHGRLHEMLERHKIPYVTIKGISSAKYYSDPLDRVMGDVDFMVDPAQIKETYQLVKGLGYVLHSEKEADDLTREMEFHGQKGSHHVVWELHPEMTNLPGGVAGDAIRGYLADLIDTAQLYCIQDKQEIAPGKSMHSEKLIGECMIPDELHHCLVLLVHTAGHLTREGVGVRHLCDWAAFIHQVSDEVFNERYAKMLRQCGLLRFAQLLTKVCEVYLGMPEKTWSGEADPALLEDLIQDIVDAGNFGFKDRSRYQQMKYINDQENNTVDQRGPIKQVFHTVNVKAQKRHPGLMKIPLTAPIGWAAILIDYGVLVLRGQRKRLNPISTVKEAGRRKKLYQQLEIYKV